MGKVDPGSVSYTVGQNIAKLRTQRGMTQQQLADAVQIDRAEISRYENGSRMMGIALMPPLAQALGVPPGQLFEKIDSDSSSRNTHIDEKMALLNRYGRETALSMIESMLDQMTKNPAFINDLDT